MERLGDASTTIATIVPVVGDSQSSLRTVKTMRVLEEIPQRQGTNNVNWHKSLMDGTLFFPPVERATYTHPRSC